MFYVNKDKVVKISRIHSNDCIYYEDDSENVYTTMERAREAGWMDGQFCVRYCGSCMPDGSGACACL